MAAVTRIMKCSTGILFSCVLTFIIYCCEASDDNVAHLHAAMFA